MAWIEIERKPAKAKLGVTLRISRQRLRNNEYLYLVRIRISGGVLAEASMAPGDTVGLLRGVAEHAGRLRIQSSSGAGRPFQIVGTGTGGRLVGNIAVSATSLGIEKPQVGPSFAVQYRVEPGAIEIMLPDPLRNAGNGDANEGPSSFPEHDLPSTSSHWPGAGFRAAARLPTVLRRELAV